MKAILLSIVFFSIFSYGCKKEDVPDTNATVNMEGTWSYIGYSGGFAGLRFTPVNSTGPYIQVNSASLLITLGNQASGKCMQYQFQADTSHNSYYQLTGLLTTSDTSYLLPMSDMKTYTVAIYNDTLTLYPTLCSDCFVSHYVHSLKHFTCSGNLH